MHNDDYFRQNIALNDEEYARGAVVLRSLPRQLRVIVTTGCNLRCIMCSGAHDRPATIPAPALASLERLYPTLEQINWQGGEILTVDYFKELFSRAARYPRLRQTLITNGTLIDEDWAEVFASGNTHLSISIDSVVRETYEHIRRGARFDALLAALERLKRARTARPASRCRTTLNVVVMRSNYRELHLLPSFCRDYGFSSLRLEFLRPEFAPAEDIFTVNRDEAALRYLAESMAGLRLECAACTVELESCIDPFLVPAALSSPAECRPLVCRFPWRQLLVDAGRGDIRPDCLCERSLGKIGEISPEEAWNNDVMQQYRRRILDGRARDWCAAACLMHATASACPEGLS